MQPQNNKNNTKMLRKKLLMIFRLKHVVASMGAGSCGTRYRYVLVSRYALAHCSCLIFQQKRLGSHLRHSLPTQPLLNFVFCSMKFPLVSLVSRPSLLADSFWRERHNISHQVESSEREKNAWVLGCPLVSLHSPSPLVEC